MRPSAEAIGQYDALDADSWLSDHETIERAASQACVPAVRS